MAAKKLSKKALNKSFWLWFHGHLTCFTYEHMQTFGYMCSMLPLIEELYDSKEEQKEALTTYSSFFNTEPQLGGSLVVGVTAGLEEARANGEEVDGDLINGIRAGINGTISRNWRFHRCRNIDSVIIRYRTWYVNKWKSFRSCILYCSMELNFCTWNAFLILQRI